MQQPAAQPINQQVQNPNLNGVNALASYNQPAKTAPKTITPALPDSVAAGSYKSY